MPIKLLADVVSVEPESFVDANRVPITQELRNVIDGSLPKLLRAIRIVDHHASVVADILTELRTKRRIDRSSGKTGRLRETNVCIAFIRREEFGNREDFVADPIVFGHRCTT